MDNVNELIKTLNDRKGDWRAIAQKAGVSYSWITKFANKKIPNSGTATVSKLSAALNPVGPKAEARPKERWDVSCNNRNGTAHYWIDSPMPGYVRSLCGHVETEFGLQGPMHAINRCRACLKVINSSAQRGRK